MGLESALPWKMTEMREKESSGPLAQKTRHVLELGSEQIRRTYKFSANIYFVPFVFHHNCPCLLGWLLHLVTIAAVSTLISGNRSCQLAHSPPLQLASAPCLLAFAWMSVLETEDGCLWTQEGHSLLESGRSGSHSHGPKRTRQTPTLEEWADT